MDTMPILIDLIMMGLLVGTIIHSIHLSKSLNSFKQLHGKMMPMMQEHAKNLTYNISQIDQMKKISTDIDQMLKSRFPGALTLKQDLEFLVGRANELADHLEAMIEKDRQKEFAILRQSKSLKTSIQSKPKNKSCELNVVAEKSVQKSTSKNNIKRPLTESFSLTKTAKKLFSKSTLKSTSKNNLGDDNHAV